MRFYWVRHGQMEMRAHMGRDVDAINRLFNQEAEGALSAKGQREAGEVARHFLASPVAAVYASPMIRARQTAEATAERLGCGVEILEDITELRTGRLPPDSAAARAIGAVAATRLLSPRAKRLVLGPTLIPFYFQRWRQGQTEGRETPAELRARLERAFAQIRESHPAGSEVALFAHGYLIFYLSAVLAQAGLGRLSVLRRPYIPNGSITILEFDGRASRPRLVQYAGTAHLSE